MQIDLFLPLVAVQGRISSRAPSRTFGGQSIAVVHGVQLNFPALGGGRHVVVAVFSHTFARIANGVRTNHTACQSGSDLVIGQKTSHVLSLKVGEVDWSIFRGEFGRKRGCNFIESNARRVVIESNLVLSLSRRFLSLLRLSEGRPTKPTGSGSGRFQVRGVPRWGLLARVIGAH